MNIFKQSTKEKSGKWNAMTLSPTPRNNGPISKKRKAKGQRPKSAESSKKYGNNAQSNRNISDGSTPDAKGKWNGPKKRFNFRCYNCNEKGHTAKRCPKKRQNQSHSSQAVTQDRKSIDIGPPAAIADEYCQSPEDEFAGTNYTAQVDPKIYENMVAFYENEMARRRGKASSKQDLPDSEAPGASIQFT
ncbi:hypothetical protein K3495_g13462 [Podosphaera aphanis]|nr:hypothetical protein K3495_g13462 [Podosphaera aphanis]